MVTSVQKTVYYRKTRFLNTATPRVLQDLVSTALTSQRLIGERTEAIGAMPDELRFIAASRQIGGFLCGRLVTFERGGYQIVVGDDPNATVLPLSAMEPQVINGIPQQYVPGVLYFVIFQNHVATIQGTALRVRALEQHLLWLLRSKTTVLPATDGFILADDTLEATQQRIRNSHVASMMIGRPLMDEVAPEQVPNGTRGRETIRYRPNESFMGLIRSIANQGVVETLNFDQVFDGDLEVWIEIRYPKYTRSRPHACEDFLDGLAISMRDIDEDDVQLKLGDGSIIRGGDLKIKGRIEMRIQNGVFDDDQVYEKLIEWLERQIRDGAVTE